MNSVDRTWWTAVANVLGICTLAIVVGVAFDSPEAFLVGLLAACVVIAVEGLAIYQEVCHFG